MSKKNPFAHDTTEDIQHDMAMELASLLPLRDASMLADMQSELTKRGAAAPVNCRYEHNPYTRFGKSLRYNIPPKN